MKIVSKQRGRKNTPEAIARMSAAKKGAIFSDEHRLNLSISHKGQCNRKGAVLSPETRAKISKALKDRKNPNNEVHFG